MELEQLLDGDGIEELRLLQEMLPSPLPPEPSPPEQSPPPPEQPPAPPPSTPSHSSYSSIPAVNNFRWARKNGFAGRYVRSQLWKATANTVQTTATGLVMSAPSLIQMVPIY